MKRKSVFVLAMSTVAITLPTLAFAQDATALARPAATTEAQPEISAGDIIVTARKRNEQLQNVPVSITAFSGDTLVKTGVRDFRDFSLNNSNVKIEAVSGGSGLAVAAAIRGNVQASSTLVVDPAVGVYIDGQIVAHTWGTIALSTDVASVQTLKGPQGTLFGRNTTGGAILIQTTDPELEKFSGYVQAEVGEISNRRFGGAVNVPLGRSAALRLVYQNNYSGDYEHLSNGVSLGRASYTLYRGKLLLEPASGMQIILTGEIAREHLNASMVVPTQPNNPVYDNIPVTAGPGGNGLIPSDPRANGEYKSYEGEFYGLRVTQAIGDGNIKLIAGHRDYSIINNLSIPVGLGYGSQNKPGNHDNSVELQFNSPLFDRRIDLAAGLFYFDESLHERQETYLYSGTQRSARLLDVTSRSASAYIQMTGHVTDRFNVTLGARYTDDKKTGYLLSSTLGATTSGTTAAAQSNLPATTQQAQNKFNYLISADFKPIDGVLLYITHSTGYRAGGSGIDRVQDNVPTVGGLPNPNYTTLAFFLPESIKNYEIGAKTQFFDRQLTINGAAFYQDYKNYQYSAVDPVSLSRVTLNANAKIKGFEVDTNLRLRSGTTLSGSVGYIDAKIDQASLPSNGAALSNIPRWTYSLGATQRFAVGTGNVDLVASYSWRSRFSTAVNDPLAAGDEVVLTNIDPLGLLNLSATYSNGNYSVAVFGTNVTNERYYTTVQNVSNGVINFGALGLPRVIGVRGKVSF